MAWYKAGTVSVTNGSRIVTGVGTAWVDAGYLTNGDVFRIAGAMLEVESFDNNGQMHLVDAYAGATATGQGYEILPIGLLPAPLSQQIKAALGSMNDILDDMAGVSHAGTGALTLRTSGDTDVTFPMNGTLAALENSNQWMAGNNFTSKGTMAGAGAEFGLTAVPAASGSDGFFTTTNNSIGHFFGTAFATGFFELHNNMLRLLQLNNAGDLRATGAVIAGNSLYPNNSYAVNVGASSNNYLDLRSASAGVGIKNYENNVFAGYFPYTETSGGNTSYGGLSPTGWDQRKVIGGALYLNNSPSYWLLPDGTSSMNTISCNTQNVYANFRFPGSNGGDFVMSDQVCDLKYDYTSNRICVYNPISGTFKHVTLT